MFTLFTCYPYNHIIFYTLRQNEFMFKYKNATIALISAICLELSITQLSGSQYVLAQNSNNADPNCYWKTTDGRSVDLGTLCGSKPQNVSPTSTNSQNLTINKVAITQINKEYYVVGTITNTGNSSQKYIQVSYQTYRMSGGSLKPNELNTAFVDNLELLPGETTIFKGKLRRRGDLFMLKDLNSIKGGIQAINICYANSVERQEWCKRLSPSSIKKFSSLR